MLHKINFKYIVVLTLALLISATQINFAGDEKSGKKDIVNVALEAGNFTTLATALTEAGLIDALKGEGPFTVFAPTDDAFSKLPKGTLESLLKDKEALKNILLYHVVSGNVKSTDVVNLKSAETLSGQNININFDGKSVMINNSHVVSADIMASNGIIHVIDTVLLPPDTK